MKKSFLALLMVSLMIVGSVAGCGNSKASGDSKDSTTSDSGEKVKLTYSYWGNDQQLEARAEMVKMFVAEHPNYEIEEIYTTGAEYATKVQTMIAAGNTPDVIACAADTSQDFIASGAFEDLTSYVENDNLQDLWFQSVIDSFTVDGKLYAAPHNSIPQCIVFNKNLFDDAGLAYPTDDWTIDEFVSDIRALTKGEGNDKTYGMYFGYWIQEVMRLYGDYYDVETLDIHSADNEKFEYIVNLAAELDREGCVISDTDTTGTTGGGFETGRYGMAFFLASDGENYINAIGDTFEWDIVAMPLDTNNERMSGSVRVNGIAVSSTSNNKDAAWEFAKWMTTNEDAQSLSAVIGIPALISYAESDYVTADDPYDKIKTVEAVEYSIPFGSFGVWGKLNDEFTTVWDEIRLENRSVDEALSDLQGRAEAIIAAQ